MSQQPNPALHVPANAVAPVAPAVQPAVVRQPVQADQSGAGATLVPHDGREPYLTPAAMARRGAEWVVTVQGIGIGSGRNKADATTLLAKEAIRRQETIVATVRDGGSKTYLSFSQIGEVKQAAPPPPGSLRPDFSSEGGTTAEVQESTNTWVEETMLSPVETPPAKRRFGLGRRK